VQFIERRLQHAPPLGFKRIRHQGPAPAAKAASLALARELLKLPAANRRASEEMQTFMRRVASTGIDLCGHCGKGHWWVVQLVLPQ
jgi:hypothetical protein